MAVLVARAQAGDAEAFGQVYDHYADQVFRFIYRRVLDRQVAEDLTSETWLRALRNLAAFSRPGGDFSAWVTTIARNLTINHLQAHQRRERPVAEVHDLVPTGDAAGPEAAAVQRLTSEALAKGIAQLSPVQQQCITLRYLRELSIEETAQALGKTPSAVKAAQHKALKALRGVLPMTVVMPA
ncbi:RNA polymerase sigma factor [Micromonospora noduli]|uniref:RNA polymerase sigma factor n=1 Tax=Micromonospora noduli TaxID=709876 RepID=UPI000DD522CE|nr:RNA polymerase sigma factor [Micromonospora noduli]